MPTFSRQSGATAAHDDRQTVAGTHTTPVSGRDDATTRFDRLSDEPTLRDQPAVPDRAATGTTRDWAATDRAATDRAAEADRDPAGPPVIAGPRPRASLLATLALITGVAAALFVLSGPLVGYGVGLAALALLFSLGGIFATRRRHVAGKSDAIIGMLLALGAIVVGVFALTGSLSWLGTDAEPVNRLREWLDAQFIERF